jgi:putative flippase GtrA
MVCGMRTLAMMVRCAGSSVAGVAVEFGLMTWLVSVLHVFYLVGALVSGGLYFVVSFVLNRYWAFRARDGCPWRQLAKHGLVQSGGMLIGTSLLWLLVQGLGLPYQLAWALGGATCFVVWTFPMQRRFTYAVAPARV